MKFTKEETRKAMQTAMKLRRRYADKLKCKFNDISLSICLKEAYKMILDTKKAMIEKCLFTGKEIQKLNGWSKLKEICSELGYQFKMLGSFNNRYEINCSPEDFNVIKEMIMEV